MQLPPFTDQDTVVQNAMQMQNRKGLLLMEQLVRIRAVAAPQLSAPPLAGKLILQVKGGQGPHFSTHLLPLWEETAATHTHKT